GGIPVVRLASGALAGVEAVIDKDYAAVVLAEAVGADALLLLTDVAAGCRSWGAPEQSRLRRLTPAAIKTWVRDGTFAAGSMGPKVVAASDFVRRTGRLAAIGVLEDAVAVLAGQAGTLIEADLAAVAGTTAGRR